jgi:hypothetical protein
MFYRVTDLLGFSARCFIFQTIWQMFSKIKHLTYALSSFRVHTVFVFGRALPHLLLHSKVCIIYSSKRMYYLFQSMYYLFQVLNTSSEQVPGSQYIK